MEGEGAYNRSSRVQAAGSLPALPLLVDAARCVPLPAATAPIVIADYGASEGRNSLAPMAAAIAALRERVGGERAISVVHTDLPDNDFAALFRSLGSDPGSYLAGDANVYPSAIGRTFYEQLLPSASVTLGWSSWAVQWLSRIPGPIGDQVQVALSRDVSVRDAYARQADADWRTFLRCRAAEMRSGARLVVLTMARDDRGDFGYGPLLVALYDSLLALVDDGLIARDEARRMVIPTVGRTRAELAAPFAAGGGLNGLDAALIDVFEADDRLYAEYEANGDAQAFGAQWAAFSRASVFRTLAAQLRGGAADSRAGSFIERMESGLAARLAAAPVRMKIPLARLVLVKAGA